MKHYVIEYLHRDGTWRRMRKRYATRDQAQLFTFARYEETRIIMLIEVAL